ncbi:NADH dehydrogenase-like protein [Solibacillus isronensis B3W22]|uniref:NADH dehydrogenase-like protein n=1 Tax=Solibacillus isronensis B3W22 TaxID=1224748 RepID=K1KH04_9BACL|nr:NAD(P)/FAD-dependent oxidoreductase [Solibacillus isronensis]AMO86467.1 NADH dehydrogenase [Solibacillus silvestris]EKB43395.1 NADH dehydrogenase-like protein [Solibacillus isronensis B3W22]
MKRPTILVLGAGYGGLTTIVNLQKLINTHEAEIILVNKNDYHYETTWLHEVGAGTISPDKARYPISKVINDNVTFVIANVENIDVNKKKVETSAGEFTYDYLVIGLGFEGETFGIPGLKEHALSLTNINTARQVREHIEYQFASWILDEVKDDSKLTIVVGGAGFTGIEFLGELGNRIPELCREFDIPQEKVRLLCVEAAPTVLPGFDPELVDYAQEQLRKKGVEFSIGTPIVEATAEGVKIKKDEGNTEFIKAGTVVWAAGVRGNALIESSGIESNRARIAVHEDMRAPGFDDVFIVGDCAFLLNEETGRPYPPTAQIAMQQGVIIAKNIKHIMNDEPTEGFVYDDKGAVCSLGQEDAIGTAFGRKFTGKPASALKKVVDDRALYLVGGVGLTLKKGKFKFI